MPIYEFYCAQCHTLFNFLSRTVNTTKRPSCPRCRRPDLERRVSRFAISTGRTEDRPPSDDLADFDEAKMERVMEELARESEGIDEENPQHLARVMRGDADVSKKAKSHRRIAQRMMTRRPHR